jgi:site-specific DNA-methyltransferase (cytosine-N4-specific)
LPFGSEFSPAQIDLVRLLELAQANTGDLRQLDVVIRAQYFDARNISADNKRKLAMNCRLGMIGYGLVTTQGRLTEFGQQLLALKANEAALLDTFARHILVNLNGLGAIQTAQDMHAHNEPFSLVAFRRWLAERGIHFPRGGKHVSTMRLWLARAGVVRATNWRVDEETLERLLGASNETIDQLGSLPEEQKAFLKTLANLGTSGPHASNEVEQLATTTYGVRFNEKGLPRQVLYPLRDAGYVTLDKHGGAGAHGSRPFQVTLTDKTRAELIVPLLDALDRQIGIELRPLLRRSIAEILEDVKSQDRHVKGLALEALAFHLMRLVDLKYVATRFRGTSTGGAEVDLIFEGARLLFSRWQIHCADPAQAVTRDDVARMAGLTFLADSRVVIVVSIGGISGDAREYVRSVMDSTRISFVMLDSNEIARIAADPICFSQVILSKAPEAMLLRDRLDGIRVSRPALPSMKEEPFPVATLWASTSELDQLVAEAGR